MIIQENESSGNSLFSGTHSGSYTVDNEKLSKPEGRLIVGTRSDDNTHPESLTFTLASDFSGKLIQTATGDLVDIQINRAHDLIINSGKSIEVGSIWLQRSKNEKDPTTLEAKGDSNDNRLNLTVKGDIQNFASSKNNNILPGQLKFENANVVVTGSVGVAGAGEDDTATKFEELNVTLTNATFNVAGDLLGAKLTAEEGAGATINVGGTMSGEFALSGAKVSAGKLQVEGSSPSIIDELNLTGKETGVSIEQGSTGSLKIDSITGSGAVGLDNNVAVTFGTVDTDMDLVFHDRNAEAHISGYGENGDVTLVIGKELNDGTTSQEELVKTFEKKVTYSGNAENKMDDFVIEQGEGNNLTGGATGSFSKDSQGNLIIDSIKKTEHTAVTTLTDIADLSIMMWRAEVNDVNLRLGDLRSGTGDNGLWVRTYGGKNKYGDSGLNNKFYALQFGYDHQIGEGSAKTYVGGAVNYTEGDSDFNDGTGDNRTMALTMYGSWFHENGSFLDVWGKYGMLKNEFDKTGGYKGTLETQAVALGVETGHRFTVAQDFFVEPQIEFVYSHIFGDSYGAGHGIVVDQKSVDSYIARVGAMAGYQFPENKGNVYLRASYAYDFDGETAADFHAQQELHHESDLGGGWYELGIGTNFHVSDTTYVYADFEYEDGGEVDTPYRWNIGLRHVW